MHIDSVKPKLRVPSSPDLRPPTNPNPIDPRSVLVSAGDQGTFGAIYSCIRSVCDGVFLRVKWFFTTIFCLESAEKIPGKTETEKLENERDQFVALRDLFIGERDKDAREVGTKQRQSFQNWWQSQYDSLPELMRTKLLKANLRHYARHKVGENLELQNQYIEAAFQDEALRDKSIRYVKDLIPEYLGRNAWDPIDNSQIPTMIQEIVADLNQEIDQQVNT